MKFRKLNITYSLRNVVGGPCITKELLGSLTRDYSRWVEAYAQNHVTPMEWAENGEKLATMIGLFHKRLCGPAANSLFAHRPNRHFITNSNPEKGYHKGDDYLEKITELLET